MSSWYFVKDGQRNGPMNREALDACIAERAVDGATLVWRPGMAEWVEASKVPELGVPPIVLPPPLPVAIPAFEQAAQHEPAQSQAQGWSRAEPFATTRTAMAPAAIRAGSYAGFGIRLGAKLIDGAVLYCFGMLVERAVVTWVFDGVAPVLTNWGEVFRLLSYTAPINTVIAMVYAVYFMAKHEATPGKRILGLRVVRADGGRLGTGRVIGRYFAESLSTITFFAGYVMAAFDDEKRTLHDYMCDTRVVRGPRDDGR